MYKVYIPISLDLESILEKEPPEFEYHIDNFYYILHLIHSIPAFSRFSLTDDGYTLVNSTLLQQAIRDYRKYIDYLISVQVLCTDGHYVKGEKSIGYAYAAAYQSYTLKPVYLHRRSLVKRHRRRINEFYTQTTPYPWLKRWINSKLRIDLSGALVAAEERLNADLNEKVQKRKALARYHAATQAAEAIHNRNYFFKVDDFAGRLHTNLSNLPGYLRKFLTYDGQPLVSVDLRNSQPFLCNRLMKPDFYSVHSGRSKPKGLLYLNVINKPMQASAEERRRALRRQRRRTRLGKEPTAKGPKIAQIGGKGWRRGRIQEIFMLVKGLQYVDKQGFISQSMNGNFYEYLVNLFNEKGGKSASRDDAKKTVFQVLFSPNGTECKKYAWEKRLFIRTLPAIYAVFAAIKQDDHTMLARILQAMEAEIFLNRISARISREKPGLFIATIHDSIVTLSGHEDYVAQIVNEELLDATGYKAKLSIEPWKSEEAIAKN